MAFIGNTPTQQAFTPAIDYFSGNGSTTVFTLSRPVASAAQVQAIVNNVSQNPSTAFTVSGNTITFTGAPSAGTNNIYVQYTSPITQVNTLTQGPSIIGPMYVSIGGGTPIGGATNPIMGLSGAANNYVQGYVNNTTNGVNSSADFVAYPSNGTDASGWIDAGITSPSYSQAAFSVTGPNEAYLFGSAPAGSGTTGNLVYATDSTGTTNAHQWYVGGFNQAKGAYVAQMISTGLQLGTGKTVTFPDATTQNSASIGFGQTWQDVSASRSAGTTYTNSTGRPISVVIKAQSTGAGYQPYMTIGGVNVQMGGSAANNNSYSIGFFIVPVGATYVLNANGGAVSANGWNELR